ncbi:branched-chain amino acid ABC transporter ATP-binding protein [Candidatus Magnetobacterium bavaricum]|uniref:Branched-chain amino acid ABC transporter ATP-binding protein n=1 Tax=Candidatus Magnetobacterium bavaricum TaxID=29290 RepID=A0A0F3GT77_9BACT|nr:branched-chain amino acid ABC transporter ATP-binding protein [Candidatus Magnetobacterium bavaricum]
MDERLLIEARGLSKSYGGLSALSDVDIAINEGEIVGLIGPNGAGKTTLVNCLSGVVSPSGGFIRFRGVDVVPEVDVAVTRPIVRIAHVMLVVAVLWGMVFSAVMLPTVVFTFETFVAVLLIAMIRAFSARRLASFAPWSRGVAIAFAVSDLITAAVWLYRLELYGGYRFFSVGPEAIQLLPLRPVVILTSLILIAYSPFVVIGLSGSGVLAAFGSFIRPNRVSALGIARTFQNIRLFKEMTVRDNVKTARHRHGRCGPLASILRNARQRAEEREIHLSATGLLEFVDLQDRGDSKALTLPYGDQRRLEIARALATGPSLLLLDEPAAGMNPLETATLVELIQEISRRGITIIVIEHDMRLIMQVCHRIIVLDHGRKIADGTPLEIRTNQEVIQAYLGVDGDNA